MVKNQAVSNRKFPKGKIRNMDTLIKYSGQPEVDSDFDSFLSTITEVESMLEEEGWDDLSSQHEENDNLRNKLKQMEDENETLARLLQNKDKGKMVTLRLLTSEMEENTKLKKEISELKMQHKILTRNVDETKEKLKQTEADINKKVEQIVDQQKELTENNCFRKL